LSNNSLRKTKETDLVRLSTRSLVERGCPQKNPSVQESATAGASWEKREDCGREEEDGRKEGGATPLEVVQSLLVVVEDRVTSVLFRLFMWLSI
jgi:hypothetical protein